MSFPSNPPKRRHQELVRFFAVAARVSITLTILRAGNTEAFRAGEHPREPSADAGSDGARRADDRARSPHLRVALPLGRAWAGAAFDGWNIKVHTYEELKERMDKLEPKLKKLEPKKGGYG
jgi:hypothetical protein